MGTLYVLSDEHPEDVVRDALYPGDEGFSYKEESKMTPELAVKNDNTLAIGNEWQAMKEQAGYLVKSGFMPPAIKTAEQAIAVILQGREVGMGPMASIRHINIIQGKPAMSAEGMLAICYKNIPGFKAEPLKDTDEEFSIRLTRPGMQPYESSFTIKDADRAGLTQKEGGNWKKYPKAMLRARAISAGCRVICPDALMGVSYTPEELGAEVDEEGNVLEGSIVSSEAKQPETKTIGQVAREKANVNPKAEQMPSEEEARLKTMVDACKQRVADFGITKDDADQAKLEVCGLPIEADVPKWADMTSPELNKLYDLLEDIAKQEA